MNDRNGLGRFEFGDGVKGYLWLFILLLFSLRLIDDFDTFWQLQSGRYLWQTKSFIYQDLFSLASSLPRLEHCWLHDLILFTVYSLGGFSLLSLLKAILIVTSAALLLWWNCRQQIQAGIALPVLTLCLLASEPSWALRPQLWTFVFALLYLLILHLGREGGWRIWVWLVPIMLFWANLHAACVFGFVLVGLFFAAESIRLWQGRSTWRRILELFCVGLAVFAVAFINPYGYKIPLETFLFHLNQHKVALGDAPATMLANMEWLPPTFAQVPLFYLVMVLWGGLILFRWRRLDPAEGIFFAAFCYMGFSQIRHTTLVSLLAGVYLPTAVAGLMPERVRQRMTGVVVLLLVFGVFLWQGIERWKDGYWGVGFKANEFPVAATDFLVKNRLPAVLYNSYDWGGYLMWRLYPDYLVFVDSRQDSPEHFTMSNTIDNGEPGWDLVLDRYGVNTIITRTCYSDTGGPIALIERLTGHRGWSLVYRDNEAVIYLRNRPEYRQTLERFALDKRQAYRTRLAEAERLWREDQTRTRALYSMGGAYLKLGEVEQGRGRLQEYLRRVPNDAEASRLLNF